MKENEENRLTKKDYQEVSDVRELSMIVSDLILNSFYFMKHSIRTVQVSFKVSSASYANVAIFEGCISTLRQKTQGVIQKNVIF